MSLEQIRDYAIKIIPYLNPQSRISIVGGEPTIHPQFFDVLNLLLEIIRPHLSIPIFLLSSGVGDIVIEKLTQIKKQYTTYEAPLRLAHSYFYSSLIVRESNIQFYIINSKGYLGIDKYVEKYYQPIFRAAKDFISEYNYSEICMDKKSCGYGVTPYGIYICAMAATISRIFKLGNGFNHIPSFEEEKKQANSVCQYCSVPCQGLVGPDISKSYVDAFNEWKKDPYFPPVLSP